MTSSKTTLQQVHVSLGDRSYPIVIGHHWLADLASPLPKSLEKIEHIACISDAAVEKSWGSVVVSAFSKTGRRVDHVTVPSGEGSKSVDQLTRLWRWLHEIRVDRQTVIVAVGGGVIGDLAGMVAATFTRGLRFVQVPTTLLAQVDSSVGGKTGINLPGAKNQVGAFWQPNFVAIDTQTLSTLPERETRSGWAEIVKYGIILDEAFFAYLEQHVAEIRSADPSITAHAIKRSCELKAFVVSQDERETTGLRAVLNYGHTFAHAIEATAGYGKYLHGEAVAIGMQMAACLAERLKRVPAGFSKRQEELLANLRLPTRLPQANPDQLIPVMQSDKKVAFGNLRFVLPTRFGEVGLVGDVDALYVRLAILDCAS